MTIYAVLIDIVSIQRYVFGSNKLKENLGGSFLIQEVYKSYLCDVINEILPSQGIDFDAWEKGPATYRIKDTNTPFEVGYIGGGNALLLFKEKEKAELFIKEWTKRLLVETPGIITAAAVDVFDLDNFKVDNQRLFKKLQENKYMCIPQTIIPRHGITSECSHTGYSMDVWNDKEDKEEQNYVSSVAYSKISVSKKATAILEKEFEGELKNEYCFTDQLDKLGQQPGEDSHIAVVHIDGNGMGERFRNTESLEAIRRLSIGVRNATKECFKKLLEEITSEFDSIEDALGYTGGKEQYYPKDKESNKKILPLRPIIIGGDDITFVSDGKLGVYFAKIFLEEFEKQSVSDGKELSACAGITITKTKYPFYRGYALAGQLCKSAKEKYREANNGLWLDFHIAYGGFSGTLEEIRESHYKSSQGDLIFRPYKVASNGEHGLETLIENTKKLKNGFPKSKIVKLRETLTLGEESRRTFVAELKARELELKLPEIEGKNYSETLFKNEKTPYFDMIELMEFYPLSFGLSEKTPEVEKA